MDARITRIVTYPLNARLRHPFTIATGELLAVSNVAVGVEIEGRSMGWGECAVLPPVTTTSQLEALALIKGLASKIVGQAATSWRPLCEHVRQVFLGYPSVSAAVEMAVVDACARHQGVPLYTLLGAHGGLVRTDITIPICSANRPMHSPRPISRRDLLKSRRR